MSKVSKKSTFDVSNKSNEALDERTLNAKNAGKVENQNQSHNARKEAFGQCQQERYR